MKKQECFVVTYRNDEGKDDVCVFYREEDAQKSMTEAIEFQKVVLIQQGYQPMEEVYGVLGPEGGEITVPDTSIYYEWSIYPSHIQ